MKIWSRILLKNNCNFSWQVEVGSRKASIRSKSIAAFCGSFDQTKFSCSIFDSEGFPLKWKFPTSLKTCFTMLTSIKSIEKKMGNPLFCSKLCHVACRPSMMSICFI